MPRVFAPGSRSGSVAAPGAMRGERSRPSTTGRRAAGATGSASVPLSAAPAEAGRIETGIAGLDRVLGGGSGAGLGRAAVGRAGHRQVDAPAAPGRQPRGDGPDVPVGLGRGIACADLRPGRSPRPRGRHRVVRPRARPRGRVAGHGGRATVPARGRFDPDVARSIRYADAWWGLPGAHSAPTPWSVWPRPKGSW